uniref:Spaetzle domain-containing protein n=1 Tax=Anopheles farauti TaxID=69004 RepID=A0A182QDI2_9DIPT
MRLALVVCGFLFGLILAPIDGRLKYAEVLPGDAFENRRMSSMATDTVTPPVHIQDKNMARSNSMQLNSKPLHSHEEMGTEQQPTDVQISTVGASASLPANCFSLADRLHKFDWSRYYLRHLTAGFPRDATNDPTAVTKPESATPEDAVGLSEITAAIKRSDFNRELSADLYAQYPSSCACQTKYELLDLGYTHFPRYIVTAICQNRNANSRKCWRGSSCKEIPYKVRVLTKRTDNESGEQDHHSALLPEPLREYWRFKTVEIAAACQCSI